MTAHEHVLFFTFGGTVTPLFDGTEIEVGPVQYKAYYNEYSDGVCHISEIKRLRKGGDASKDTDWARDNLGYEVVRQIEHSLEDAVRREQQRIVESYDEEMRRFG